MNIGAIVTKQGKDVKTNYYDTMIENYVSSDKLIDTFAKSKKCPDGRKVDYCVYHSYFNDKFPQDGNERKRLYDYCFEGLEDYAFCTTDFKVYDCCYIKDEKQKKQQEEFYRLINEKVHKYDKNMEITYRLHDEFMINFEKRKQLIQKKNELDKAYGSSGNDIKENPQYITLFQLLHREEEALESKRNNIEKVYNLKHYEISKEEFIATYTKDEVEKRDKAKMNLEHWCNKNQKGSISKEQETLMKLEFAIKNITDILLKSFDTPCVYIYKAVKALEDLKFYFKKDYTKKDFVKTVEEDLEKCKTYFEIYKEFIGDKHIDVIISKVEREQAQAAAEERKNKQQSKFVQKAQSGQNSFVVKLDGTVEKDTNEEPKLIIGSSITGNVDDEKWRGVRSI
jgi:hypothetical protein